MKRRKQVVWLSVLAVVMSIAGASLITYAVLPPHSQTSVSFAGFCWLVVIAAISRMIWVVRNSSPNKEQGAAENGVEESDGVWPPAPNFNNDKG